MNRAVTAAIAFAIPTALAAYIAFAPLAAQAPLQELAPPLGLLDDAAYRLSSIAGSEAAAGAFAALGVVLALLVALVGRGGREQRAASPAPDKGDTPRPAWRPEPHNPQDRIASLRRRAHAESLAGSEPVPLPYEAPVASPAIAAGSLVLLRKPRDPGRDWFDDGSWLGGLPRLGTTPWPRGQNGAPLPFAAQIDFAEIARARPGLPLPATGSLAFFLGEGAVVAASQSPAFSDPPSGLPPAFEEGGTAMPATPGPLSRHFFPFWPVAILPKDDAVSLPAPRNTPFHAEGETLWWHGAVHLGNRLRAAAQKGADENLSADTAEGLRGVIAAMDEFTAGRDLWTPLSADEAAVIADLLDELRAAYPAVAARHLPDGTADLAALSLRTMVTGAPEAVAAMPDTELARINAEYRAPLRRNHCMFAPAGDASAEIVLLQLASDDMMEWRWPGMADGVAQFRIGSEALHAGRWHEAWLEFRPG